MSLSVPKIYEVLAEKFVLRSKWQKNHQRGAVPQAQQPRQVVQMDSILLGQVFAFTASETLAASVGVDIFSKEADVYLSSALTAQQGSVFLQRCITRRFTPGFVQIIQTDGGSEFEGDFARCVSQFCAQHRVARPYKKNEQSFIESFNRTVRAQRVFGLAQVSAARDWRANGGSGSVLAPLPLPSPAHGFGADAPADGPRVNCALATC